MGVGDGSLSKEIFEWFDYARRNILQQRIKPSAERTSLTNGKDTTAPRGPRKACFVGRGGVILSRLVDTFISRISLTMLPVPNPHNTACVLSWRKPAIGRADPPIIPVAEEVSPNKDL